MLPEIPYSIHVYRSPLYHSYKLRSVSVPSSHVRIIAAASHSLGLSSCRSCLADFSNHHFNRLRIKSSTWTILRRCQHSEVISEHYYDVWGENVKVDCRCKGECEFSHINITRQNIPTTEA